MKLDQPKLRREITDRIIEGLKNGCVPWRKPWNDDPNLSGTATNCVTRKPYRGVNTLVLGLHALKNNYSSKWWGTEKQWKRLKATIKTKPDNLNTDEWGVNILFCSAPMRRMHEGKKRLYFIFRQFVVYNLDQVEGKSVDYLRKTDPEKITQVNVTYQAADELVKAIGADVRYGFNKAQYILPEPYEVFPNHTNGDYIEMPRLLQFKTTNSFYETLFHELAHWAEARVGWKRFEAKNTYEMGELVAEMAACYLSTDLMICLITIAICLIGWTP
jgi:antirestriction protein ArdC